MDMFCQFCNEKFNLRKNLPRTLPVCKHRICDLCLQDHFRNQFNIICEVDNLIYQIVHARIDQFAIDKDCLLKMQNKKNNKLKKRNSTKMNNNQKDSRQQNDSDYQQQDFQDKAQSQFHFVDERQRITRQGKNLVISDISNLYSNQDEFELEDQSQFQSKDSSIYHTEQSMDNRTYQNDSQDVSYSMQYKTEDDYYQEKMDRKFDKKYCKEHKLFKDEVCLQCSQKICAKCALYGGHKDHHNQVKSYKIFLKEVDEYKQSAEQWLKKIKQKEKFLKIDFLEKVLKEKTQTKYKLLKNEIQVIFEKTAKKLEIQKKNILNSLKDKFSNKKKSIKENILKFIEEQEPQKKEVITNIKQITQILENKNNENVLMEIMREKEELNLYNSVRQFIRKYKKHIKNFSENFENFINKIKIQRNESLSLEFAWIDQPNLTQIHSENQLSSDTDFKKQLRKRSNTDNDQSQIATQVLEDDLLNMDSKILEFGQESFIVNQKLNSFPNNQLQYQRSDVSNKKDSFVKQKTFRSFQRHQSMVCLPQNQTFNHNVIVPHEIDMVNQSEIVYNQNATFLRSGDQENNTRNHSRQLSTSMSIGTLGMNKKTKNKDLIQKIQKFANSKNQTLILNSLKIEDQDLENLAQLLRNQNHLRSLQLKNNKITDKGIECLVKELKQLKLTLLDFSNNLLTTKSLKTILKFIDTFKVETIIAKNIPIKEEQKKNYIQKFQKKKIELVLNQQKIIIVLFKEQYIVISQIVFHLLQLVPILIGLPPKLFILLAG